MIARRTGTVNYTATATIDGTSLGDDTKLSGGTKAGIASYRSGFEAIGVAVGNREAVVWQRRKGRFRERAVRLLPGTRVEHVRMVARGNRFLLPGLLRRRHLVGRRPGLPARADRGVRASGADRGGRAAHERPLHLRDRSAE